MAQKRGLSAVGGWLRAVISHDRAQQRRLAKLFDDDALHAVLDAAFSLVVNRRFAPDIDVREITRQALGVRQRYGEKAPPLLELEMVVRRELGEPVPIGDLDRRRIDVIKTCMLEQLVYDLALFDDELNALIREAESAAGRAE